MNVIIIEDEELSSARLERMILQYNPKINILAKIESIKESIEWLQNNEAPDLIFLDIHLEDGLSFAIFENTEVQSAIIFTTAFDEYAIRAFKLKSIDYLLKPIVQEELNNAINKYTNLIGSNNKGDFVNISGLIDIIQTKGMSNSLQYKKRYSVQIGHKIKAVSINEIAYFFSEDGITYFVTNSKQKYNLDESLDQIESEIDPDEYYRANRSFLINISSIQNVTLFPKSRLKLELNPSIAKEIYISSEKSKHFRQWLDK